MDKPKIELITCSSGDWKVLKVNSEINYENHSIPDFAWLSLLEGLGCEVHSKEISDEDMEESNY